MIADHFAIDMGSMGSANFNKRGQKGLNFASLKKGGGNRIGKLKNKWSMGFVDVKKGDNGIENPQKGKSLSPTIPTLAAHMSAPGGY